VGLKQVQVAESDGDRAAIGGAPVVPAPLPQELLQTAALFASRAPDGVDIALVQVQSEQWRMSPGGPLLRRIEQQITASVRPIAPAAGWSRTAMLIAGVLAGLALAALVTLGAAGMAMLRKASERPASLALVLPLDSETGKSADSLASTRPLPPVRQAGRLAAASPAVSLPVEAPESAQPAPAGQSRTSALDRAFAENDAQPWREGEASGWVVVGPAAKEGGRTCRDVAMLTRVAGEPDRTVNERRCQSGKGVIELVSGQE
jgi:hypothetical protein